MSKYWIVAFLVVAVLLLAAGCPKAQKDGGQTITPEGRPGTDAVSQDAQPGDTPVGDATTPDGMPAADDSVPPVTDPNAPATEPAPEGEPPATDATPGGTDVSNDPNVTLVVLETTVGNITVAVHKDWAPIGAEHFLMLVGAGYYDGAPFFRVMENFMAQCGFSGNYELTKKYMEQTIQDEPVLHSNLKGTLSFGNTGRPNSRSTHIFINFKDNTMLDGGAAPFPAFAEVVEGMDVVSKIYITDENPPTMQQVLSMPDGIEQFKKQYPDATFITKAYVKP